MPRHFLMLILSAMIAAGCSSSAPTTPPATEIKHDSTIYKITLSTPALPDDTVYLRSSDTYFQFQIQTFVDSIPAAGVRVIYYDPTTKTDTYQDSYGGYVNITIAVQSFSHDTIVNYIFTGLYGPSVSLPLKKVFNIRTSVKAPLPVRAEPLDESHLKVSWARVPSDVFADTVFVKTDTHAFRLVAAAGDTSVVVGNLSPSEADSITLHTQGGISSTTVSGTAYSFTGKFYEIWDSTASPIGLQFTPDGIRALPYSLRDSSDLFFVTHDFGFTVGPVVATHDVLHDVDGAKVTGSITDLVQLSSFSASAPIIGSTGLSASLMYYPDLHAPIYTGLKGKGRFLFQIDTLPNGLRIQTDASGDFLQVHALYQPFGFMF